MKTSIVVIALGLALAGAPAYADDPAPVTQGASDYSSLEQIQLTDDQVTRYVGSLADMQKAMGDAPADSAEPDAKTMAKLEKLAKAHGFRSFDDYNSVAGNIALVVDGVDPETKTYVGSEKMIQKALEEVKADKKMPPADKDTATKDLDAQLKAVVPVKFKSNIDLVIKHYDQINGS